MKRIAWYLMAIFVALAAISDVTPSQTTVPHSVSFLQLVANPKKFDGQLISVTGFLSLDPPDGNMLYLHKEDFDNGILSNAVGVEVTKEMRSDSEKLDESYVQIVGIFQSGEKHGNRYSVITAAEGDEMEVTAASDAFQTVRHEGKSGPPFENPQRVGHPGRSYYHCVVLFTSGYFAQ